MLTSICTAAIPSVAAGPTDVTMGCPSSVDGAAPHDLHDGVLGEAEIAADQAIGQPVAVHGEDQRPSRLSIIRGPPRCHAALQSTEIYLRTDPTERLETLAAMAPPMLKPGRFRAPDKLLAMLSGAERKSRYAE
jgi:hypothetical protein